MRDRTTIRDIIQWDVATWKRALDFWNTFSLSLPGASMLEIGAGNGGLSLYFAMRGCQVTCTDLRGVSHQAIELHQRYGVTERITYRQMDATHLEIPSAHFDLVCFKSVLGGIGWDGDVERQRKAVAEIHRVLKPGGMLLFAENLRASPLHRWLRMRFVSWGKRWRYLALDEIPALFDPFVALHLQAYGCLAAFGRNEWQHTLLHLFDLALNPWIPNTWKYVVFGYARKGNGEPIP